MRKPLVILALVLLSAVAVSGQQAPTKPEVPPAAAALSKDEVELLLNIKMAELQTRSYALSPDSNKENAGATDRLAELYSKAVRSPGVMRLLVGEALSDYYEIKEHARGAAQVSQAADEANMRFQPLMLSQNQTIIEQNQRIIALLEQLVRKR